METCLELTELCKKLDRVPVSKWGWENSHAKFSLLHEGTSYLLTRELKENPFPCNNAHRPCFCLVVEDGSSVKRYSTDDREEVAVGKVALWNLYNKLRGVRAIEDSKVLAFCRNLSYEIAQQYPRRA